MGHYKLICTECGEEATYCAPWYGFEHWECNNQECDNDAITDGTDTDDQDVEFKIIGYWRAD